MRLQGKIAIVTGGAMGIGFATAQRLLDEGCSVTIWDFNGAALEAALAALRSSGKDVRGYVCDVSDSKRVYALAAQAIKEMGRIDILINNAGYVYGSDIIDGPDEAWERTIAVNLTALVYTIRAVLPHMYERNSGHIVNLSSAAGMLGVPKLAVYSATKWAVWGLTESLRFEARERGKRGVRFSSIHPSYLSQGMFAGARLNWMGNLVIPLVPNHDVIARGIVDGALKKGHYSPKRPVTLNLAPRLRGLLPDRWFQELLAFLGVPQSMQQWKGRNE